MRIRLREIPLVPARRREPGGR